MARKITNRNVTPNDGCFPCHISSRVIWDGRKGKVIQGCPECGKEYILNYEDRKIEPLHSGASVQEDRITLDLIYRIVKDGNTAEVKQDREGRLKIYEVGKKLKMS